MKSPRKSKYITAGNVHPNTPKEDSVTKQLREITNTPKEDSVTKQLREIAVLRSHHKHHEGHVIGKSLKSQFKTIKDIAEKCGDDPKNVYRLLSKPSEKRIQKKYKRKLTDKDKNEVHRIYLDDQVSYCLPDMKYADYRFMSCTLHEAYYFIFPTAQQNAKLRKKHSRN